DSLIQQCSEKGLALLQTAAADSDPIRAAIRLTELERTFSNYPAMAANIDTAWTQLLGKANLPNLKDQAKLIDQAQQAETAQDKAAAIAAYELVSATYPSTKAAEFAQTRLSQLQAPKAVARLWKSKSGKFSVTATVVAFDGKSVQLRTDEGK